MGVCGMLLAALLGACSVTPEPMSEGEREVRAAADLKVIHAKRYEPVRAISLYEAMARAVAFNLQHSVRQIERDIAEMELRQVNEEGFPDVEASGGQTRDSAKVSSDTNRNIRSGSIGATWSLLDLGVSYARAKQSADRVMVAEERRRKALQDIVRSVRLAYWKAVGAQQLMTRMVAIERDFSEALAESRRLEVTSVETRRRTVGFRRGLIDTVRQLIAARKEYGRAKLEFAQLINVRPGVRFTLQPPETGQGIPALPVALEEMEAFALENRPELGVEDYNERITDWESREALYGMFPGLDLELTRNFSTDTGLVNTSWGSVGATLGMNLFRVFSGALQMEAAGQRGELARRQRLALSVAVLAQVHIAAQEYREANYQFRLARQISRSDEELSQLAMAERKITAGNMLDVVDVAARQLRSEVEQHRAYVELRRSHGDVLHALGLDAVPTDVRLDDIDGLRLTIRRAMEKWETLAADSDPANDGSIEDLVGRVLADLDRGMVGPMNAANIAQVEPDLTLALQMEMPVPANTGSKQAAAAVDGNTAATPEEPAIAMSENQPALETEMAEGSVSLAGPDEAQAELSEPSIAGAPEGALAELQKATPPTPYSAAPIGVASALAAGNRETPETVADVLAQDASDIDPGDNTKTARLQVELWALQQSDVKLAALDPPPPIVEGDADAVGQSAPPMPRLKRHLPNYDVQFGAFSEIVRARQLLASLRSRHQASGESGDDRDYYLVRKLDAKRQVMFHVQFGTYLGWTAALNACNDFARHGPKCVVVRHHAAPVDLAASTRTPKMNRQADEKADHANYGVQFGVFSESWRAQGLLARLQGQHRPSDQQGAGRRYQVVRKLDPAAGVRFHVRYGNYIGRTAARSACDAFARKGQKCVIVRLDSEGERDQAMQAACEEPSACGLRSPVRLAQTPPLTP
jgi:outer membrane protein TolC